MIGGCVDKGQGKASAVETDVQVAAARNNEFAMTRVVR